MLEQRTVCFYIYNSFEYTSQTTAVLDYSSYHVMRINHQKWGVWGILLMFSNIWNSESMPCWHWKSVEYYLKKTKTKTPNLKLNPKMVLGVLQGSGFYVLETTIYCNPSKTIDLQLQNPHYYPLWWMTGVLQYETPQCLSQTQYFFL